MQSKILVAGILLSLFLSDQGLTNTPKPSNTNLCAQVFVVGTSESTKHKAHEFTNILRKFIIEFPSIQLVNCVDKLQDPIPANIKTSLDMASKEIQAGKKSFKEMDYIQTQKHAEKAINTFNKMSSYMVFDRYKEALLLKALSLTMQGDVVRAKSMFLDLLILDPDFSLQPTEYQDFVVELFNQTKEELPSLPIGAVSVNTVPEGCSLYVDGKHVGTTSYTIDGIRAGPHFVEVKMAGYQKWGTNIDVKSGRVMTLDVKLVSSNRGQGFTKVVEDAVRAVSDERRYNEVLSLGQKIGLNFVVLGQLTPKKRNKYRWTLYLYMFDFNQRIVVHKDKRKITITDYNIDENMRNFGYKFITEGIKALMSYPNKDKKGQEKDRYSEIEEWTHSDFIKDSHKKKQSKDPLDDINGTEDW